MQPDSDSYAIVTTDASPMAAVVHKRMPVVLSKQACERWLDTSKYDIEALTALLIPYAGADLQAYPGSTYVNSPQNTDQTCIQPM